MPAPFLYCVHINSTKINNISSVWIWETFKIVIVKKIIIINYKSKIKINNI